MSEQIKVRRGTKIDPAELNRLDAGKFAVLISQIPESAVQAQYRYDEMTQCPWCGNFGWVAGISTGHAASGVPVTVICGRCGMAFQA
jgi:hypothetical protein